MTRESPPSPARPTLSTWKGKWQFFSRIYGQQKQAIAAYIVVSLLFSVINAIIPLFTKLQIDQLQWQRATVGPWSIDPYVYLLLLMLVPAGLELIRLRIFERLREWISHTIDLGFRRATDDLIWQKMREFDAGFFESKRNSFLLQEGQRASHVVDDLFRLVSERLTTFTTFFTIFPILLLIDWRLFGLIALTSLIQLWINQQIYKLSQAYTLADHQRYMRRWRVQEALRDHYYDLKTQGDVDAVLAQSFALRDEDLVFDFQRSQNNRHYNEWRWFSEQIFLLAANAYVGYQVFQGNMSIGTFTLAVSYSSQILNFFQSLIDTLSRWQMIELSLLKLGFFFQLRSRLRSSEQTLPVPASPTVLELKHVSFAYPDFYAEEQSYIQIISSKLEAWSQKHGQGFGIESELKELRSLLSEKRTPRTVLQDVSLRVERGQIVALVGRNGSGKTTLTHLLQHHYEPDKGEVLLDGQPLYEYDQETLLRQFSWLKQTPFMVDRYTIRENLLMGTPSTLDDQALWQLLQKLRLDGVIEELPQGLDASLGEDTALSGGQTQLLSLARALLQHRPFIVFDEGSSQLDVEKEFLVLQQLQEQKQQAGILFITHRMSVARKADYIYVIDEGRIVEEGTHAELLTHPGLYAQFWSMQVVE